MKILGPILIAIVVCVLSAASAQGKKRLAPGGSLEPDDRCTCTAGGVNCLFGDAGGCSVTCPAGWACDCAGASCRLGFPFGAHCRCLLQIAP